MKQKIAKDSHPVLACKKGTWFGTLLRSAENASTTSALRNRTANSLYNWKRTMNLRISRDLPFNKAQRCTRRNATIPWKLKGAIKWPFSHHLVDWISSTFQWPLSAIQPPFRRLSEIFTFLFSVCNWFYMHYFLI